MCHISGCSGGPLTKELTTFVRRLRTRFTRECGLVPIGLSNNEELVSVHDSPATRSRGDRLKPHGPRKVRQRETSARRWQLVLWPSAALAYEWVQGVSSQNMHVASGACLALSDLC